MANANHTNPLWCTAKIATPIRFFAPYRGATILVQPNINHAPKYRTHAKISIHTPKQGGITCGAIEEASKSSKTIDERVIINFRDKNVVIAHFRNKNDVFCFYDKINDMSWFIMIYIKMYDKNVAILFYQLPIFSIDSNSVLSIAILFYR